MIAIWTLHVTWLFCKEQKRRLDSKIGKPFHGQFRIWKSISSMSIRQCQRTCLARLQHQCLSICRAHTHTLQCLHFNGSELSNTNFWGCGKWAVASLPCCLNSGGDQGMLSRGNYNCSSVGFCSVSHK